MVKKSRASKRKRSKKFSKKRSRKATAKKPVRKQICFSFIKHIFLRIEISGSKIRKTDSKEVATRPW